MSAPRYAWPVLCGVAAAVLVFAAASAALDGAGRSGARGGPRLAAGDGPAGLGGGAGAPGREGRVPAGPGGPAADLAPDAAASGLVEGEIVAEGAGPVAGAQIHIVGVSAAGEPVIVPPYGPSPRPGLIEHVGELGVVKGAIPLPPPAAAAPVSPLISDGAGRFRVSVPAGHHAAIVTHPAFTEARSESISLAAGGTARVRVVLRPAVVVRGRVLDERGLPIAGAELYRGADLVAISDASGAFELRGLGAGAEIEARARGRLVARKIVDPADGSPLEFALAPAAGRLAGTVTDERAFPIAGARIFASAGAFRSEALSDRAGRFAIDGLPPGEVAVRVEHSEHPPLVATGSAGDDLRLPLAPGAGVEGEVRDERTGAVLAGARITVESSSFSRATVADRNGRFRALGCPPGPALIRASARLYLPAARAVELPPGAARGDVTLRDLRIDLALGGAISGVVRDSRGAPAAGVAVEAGEGDARASARSDARGKFRIAPVAAGRVEVRAGSAAETVHVDAGRETTIDLRLRPPP